MEEAEQTLTQTSRLHRPTHHVEVITEMVVDLAVDLRIEKAVVTIQAIIIDRGTSAGEVVAVATTTIETIEISSTKGITGHQEEGIEVSIRSRNLVDH